jgi:Ca2+ transporting ATPase
MVTGDNILTATAIARECGILPKKFISSIGSYEVIEGKKFRELVGNLKESKDADGKTTYNV